MGLPVLNSVLGVVQQEVPKLNRIAFVCVQHLLDSTLDIFEALIQLGAKPDNIFLLGKHYSTSPEVVEKAEALGIQVQNFTPLTQLGTYKEVFDQDITNLWLQVRRFLEKNTHSIDKLIVLDDGGKCFKSIPKDILREYNVVGIEQTTAGLTEINSIKFHDSVYIDIAKSASKSLEVGMVSNAVVNKIANQLPCPQANPAFGIVGVGAIGTALAKRLASVGYNVSLYDPCHKESKNSSINAYLTSGQNIKKLRRAFTRNFQDLRPEPGKLEWVDSVEALFQKSEYIFGCTGKDFTKNLDIDNLLVGNKHLISCSSEDKEFLSILHRIQELNPNNTWDPLKDIYWQKDPNSLIHLIKGGFPCNFDDTGTSVPSEDIQLTRALIFGGLIQAVITYSSYKMNRIRGTMMLDPSMQRFIVSKWAECREVRDPKIDQFKDFNWIIKNSNGQFHQLAHFSALFEKENQLMVKEAS